MAQAATAAVIYSVYILAGARLMKKVSALAASSIVIASAAAVYTVIAVARGPRLPSGPVGWIGVAALALVSTVGAVALFFAGMERIGPTDAAALSTLEPVVAVCLAALFLGEKAGPLALSGGVLILAAVLVLARAGRRPRPVSL